MRYGFCRMSMAATTASSSTVSAEGAARAAASTTGTPCLNGQMRRSFRTGEGTLRRPRAGAC
ncbi:expressed unknown protein [Ectocarpus siliculosus]|uniref:Uncharacterized protein n=1 Tax=Ectocarpus siliculosus TaxID=2880 RepID=D7G2S8_ECTSI|nr:expressed unknown protein [Ectocarpus siliculosus]|eukprot:CBJ33432.1 expressed unknown protein [Ectocarpus siliculosus]